MPRKTLGGLNCSGCPGSRLSFVSLAPCTPGWSRNQAALAPVQWNAESSVTDPGETPQQEEGDGSNTILPGRRSMEERRNQALSVATMTPDAFVNSVEGARSSMVAAQEQSKVTIQWLEGSGTDVGAEPLFLPAIFAPTQLPPAAVKTTLHRSVNARRQQAPKHAVAENHGRRGRSSTAAKLTLFSSEGAELAVFFPKTRFRVGSVANCISDFSVKKPISVFDRIE